MMTDWSKQAETLLNTWADAQKKMWDGWFRAVQARTGEGGLDSVRDETRKALDAWEASVQRAIDAQKEWMRAWTEGTPAGGETASEWAKRSRDMMKSWTESQEAFVRSWFEAARRMDGSNLGEIWETQGRAVMKAWEDAANRAVEAQRDIAKLWQRPSASGSTASSGTEPGERPHDNQP